MRHSKLSPNAAPVPPNGERLAASRRLLAAGYEGLRLPAAVLLDNVRSMYNVGAFFRAADGVGIEKGCLCGITAHPPKKAITKTALGAEEAVAWEHDWDALPMAEKMRRSGFAVAAIETSMNSVDLFEWQPRFPVCVAFGNEVEGLRPELLALADTHVRIPMLGEKTSLNVATAAGIVLYELLRKYRAIRMSAGMAAPGLRG
ncbi:MAG TPA: TrmH family RNA methyltransferase [Candidatus Sulfotelmatobacter sp.]|nr:TrmH family RNA methyltransferase [Candidatus Sulfotelmatobacter sp.]